jgi:hypothetical protein
MVEGQTFPFLLFHRQRGYQGLVRVARVLPILFTALLGAQGHPKLTMNSGKRPQHVAKRLSKKY